MYVYPFSGYLDYFPNSYGEIEVERKKLNDFSFPVDPEIMENKGYGLTPIRRNGQDFFNVRELMGYARTYSIPNLGYISRKPIRPAEILDTEAIEDEETGEIKIKCVHIAVAYIPPEDRRYGSGQVVFICPFCGDMHSHGCDGEKFGDGDGWRIPHCSCEIPAFYRINFQKYGLQLAPCWQFNLVETEDVTLAGAFPRQIAKDIVNRFKAG